jgi:hypothetical protein
MSRPCPDKVSSTRTAVTKSSGFAVQLDGLGERGQDVQGVGLHAAGVAEGAQDQSC